MTPAPALDASALVAIRTQQPGTGGVMQTSERLNLPAQPPEFLNRIDEVIVFRPLRRGDSVNCRTPTQC